MKIYNQSGVLIKKANKMNVFSLIRKKAEYIVNPDAMFHVHVYFVTEHHYFTEAV